MRLRTFAFAALAACCVSLAGCGADAEVIEYCRLIQTCECEGNDCCINKEGVACYEGQCCGGLSCQAGVCVPEAS